MELVKEVKELLMQTAKTLKGSERRLFMAKQSERWENGGNVRRGGNEDGIVR